MKKIKISNLKNIKNLEFEIPKQGVYLLCGSNGSGKTSLLACLLRIGRSNALPLFFRSSTLSKSLDQFEFASLTYTLNQDSVNYRYAGQRWVPLPRSKATLLKKYGYPEVYFFGANAKRIEPQKDDIKSIRYRDASDSIKNEVSSILNDDKFKNLKYVSGGKGGKIAYLLQATNEITAPKKQIYFTERNFSLGELCVLKLVIDLEKCKKNSLVLIDELELALHPTAQIRLFKYLEKITNEKNLTTVFSTHSVSLIRNAKRNQLLLLRKQNGITICTEAPYTAEVIGELAFQQDNAVEKVFCVEDIAAKYCLEGLIDLLLQNDFSNKPKPSYVVVPLGTFNSVIDFVKTSPAILKAPSVCNALLDRDVYDESIKQWASTKRYESLQKYSSLSANIKFLPWTPEVGLCNFFNIDFEVKISQLRAFLNNHTIDLSDINWSDVNTIVCGPQRKMAKNMVATAVTQISHAKACTEEKAEHDLYRFFTQKYFETEVNSIRNLLLPLLS